MIRVPSRQYGQLLTLLERSGSFFPLIQAVLAGQQPGFAFADQLEDPHSAAVLTRTGFLCTFGDDDLCCHRFNQDFAAFLHAPYASTPTYLLWYAPSTWWIDWFATQVRDTVRMRNRIRLTWDPAAPRQSGTGSPLPAGSRMCLIDGRNFSASVGSGLDIDQRFWRSKQDFLVDGIGVILLDARDDPLCICYSACVAGRFAEVDIWTDPAHRQRGLGAMTARAFIAACAQRGLTPTWDCFSTNAASFKLAQQLGFVETAAYAFYSFNIPLAR